MSFLRCDQLNYWEGCHLRGRNLMYYYQYCWVQTAKDKKLQKRGTTQLQSSLPPSSSSCIWCCRAKALPQLCICEGAYRCRCKKDSRLHCRCTYFKGQIIPTVLSNKTKQVHRLVIYITFNWYEVSKSKLNNFLAIHESHGSGLVHWI